MTEIEQWAVNQFVKALALLPQEERTDGVMITEHDGKDFDELRTGLFDLIDTMMGDPRGNDGSDLMSGKEVTYKELGIDLNGAKPTGMMEIVKAKFLEYDRLYEEIADTLLDKDLWKENGSSASHVALLEEMEVIKRIKVFLMDRLTGEYYKNIERFRRKP